MCHPLYFVTVDYNCPQSTDIFLRSLVPQAGNISLVVVVDNASSIDNSAMTEEVVSRYQGSGLPVSLVRSKKNLGYFGGLNYGLEHLTPREEGARVVIANNDLEFSPEFVREVQRFDAGESIFVVCPSVKTRDGVFQNPSMSRPPGRKRVFFYRLYYSNYYLGKALLFIWRALGLGATSRRAKIEEEGEIFIGIGAIFVLTENFFSKNLYLDYPLFLYGEEAFLSMQVKRSGGVQWYCPRLEVVHDESVATSRLPSKNRYYLTQKAFRVYKDYFLNG